MKLIPVLALLGLGVHFVAASDAAVRTQDKTITKVVKLLQGMLDKSVTEGDEERKIYAKFKCYCDQSEAEKTASIADATKQISILESKIEELQGSNGEASSKSAKLKADMAANKAERDTADALRNKENKAFKAEKSDLEQAIGQMESAIDTLTAVGADQTKSTGADNKQFMAGHKASSLLSLGSAMKSALTAAEAFMSEKDYSQFNSFLQAPFTGTYTSQSGQVMGIIKSMRDTFKTNLASAIDNEATSLKSFNEFMEVKTDAYNEMSDLYDGAQASLGGNDQDLGTKRSQLSEAKKSKDEDEEFLEKLLPMCKAKGKDYNERKLMRASEEAAVAEAMSILNSDEAFATFGGVSATSSGKTSFLQISKHIPTDDVRAVMQRLLRRAAAEEGHATPRLGHVISQLQAGNPFDSVLEEIETMVGVIDEEGKADKEKLDWCKKERKDNKKSIKDKNSEILKLEGDIDSLTKAIEDPATGLKHNIAETEASLLQNKESQATETTDRTEENAAYQKDVKNLVAAEGLLSNAINVLKAYYDQIDKAFLQSFAQEDPTPPGTWKNDSYKGQSAKGGDAVGMLKFILEETRKEETEAHSLEEKGQAEYEDSMTELKKNQAQKEKSISKLQETLATKEADLLEANENHKDTTKSRDEDEAYLATIKPGCDFITSNFKLRNQNRKTEKEALQKAVSTLKGSPAYKNAAAEATEEGFGNCKDHCTKDINDVKCKACQADVTVPAYCAGHKGTKGC